jgi:MraZ protein
MASFKGQASYSVDGKGRVAIPAKMRAVLAPEAKGTFTMTRGFERCIFLYPLDEWERMEAEIAGLNMYSRQSRDFVRSILMWADEVTLDAQGRVPLTRQLMDYAGIGDKALIIGALDHVEIWNPDAFRTHMDEQSGDYEALAERVMGG